MYRMKRLKTDETEKYRLCWRTKKARTLLNIQISNQMNKQKNKRDDSESWIKETNDNTHKWSHEYKVHKK